MTYIYIYICCSTSAQTDHSVSVTSRLGTDTFCIIWLSDACSLTVVESLSQFWPTKCHACKPMPMPFSRLPFLSQQVHNVQILRHYFHHGIWSPLPSWKMCKLLGSFSCAVGLVPSWHFSSSFCPVGSFILYTPTPHLPPGNEAVFSRPLEDPDSPSCWLVLVHVCIGEYLFQCSFHFVTFTSSRSLVNKKFHSICSGGYANNPHIHVHRTVCPLLHDCF